MINDLNSSEHPTYLFLDTEWADAAGAQLVSLALISEDGQHVFYAERDPLPVGPGDFVRAVVYPLLDRGAFAISDVEFTRRLRTFLAAMPSPHVLFDYPNDGALLRHALAGFSLPEAVVATCGPRPIAVMTQMLREDGMTTALEAWFAEHPDALAKRHHALIDAQALRMAWRIVTGRAVSDASGPTCRAPRDINRRSTD